MSTRQKDTAPPQVGRYRLGNRAFLTETDGKIVLELDGEVALTLPGGETVFFSLPDGGELFAVEGMVHCITNKYIITEEIRYSGETADATYSVYGVYTHEGTLVESPGLSADELYLMGYVQEL